MTMGDMVFPVSIRSVLLGPCIGLAAACTAPRPNPYVVTPKPGETLTSISGPMPDFGTYTSVSDALLAACPVIIRQPHAVIPVPRNHQDFSVYWRTASEYCAWLYSIDGAQVEMSLLTTSPLQDDPTRRRCDLPAQVIDRRQPEAAVAYPVMLHNLRYTVDNGRLMRKVIARVAWSDAGVPKILPVEERQ